MKGRKKQFKQITSHLNKCILVNIIISEFQVMINSNTMCSFIALSHREIEVFTASGSILSVKQGTRHL